MARLGLVGTLLISTTIALVSPILKKGFVMLDNFDEFTQEFQACSGIMDSTRTTINMI